MRIAVTLFALLCALWVRGRDAPDESLFDLDMEALTAVRVSTASGADETVRQAPATMIVITAQDIRRRGYTGIDEVIADLPGFDISHNSGTNWITAYQRGYRTPFTQRTLLMVDNKVDNHLWSHIAHLTRQYPLSHVARIEVLYGPASAVYGANAFLGIINIVTRKADVDAPDLLHYEVNAHGGSYKTSGVDLSAQYRTGKLAFSLGFKGFESDEADLSDQWGFLRNDLYGSRAIFGPLLDQEINGRPLGTYYNPSEDWGVLGRLTYDRRFELSFMSWSANEGWGTTYTADHIQSNGNWYKKGSQVHLDYRETLGRANVHLNVGYRTNDLEGNWAEAFPDENDPPQTPVLETHSWVSLTDWRSVNHSWIYGGELTLEPLEGLTLMGGAKLERKELTRAYDVSGYYEGSFSSVIPPEETGPYGLGAGIYHSTDPFLTIPAPPSGPMPAENLVDTRDVGGFVQAIFDVNKFRFNLGLRADHNSEYGSSTSPRLSLIYQPKGRTTCKLVYGEGFQEPPPILLYGGWQGRNANPDLKPETVRNLEFILIHGGRRMLHEVSVYRAHYNDVIQEDAVNDGKRDITGLEYRLHLQLPALRAGWDRMQGRVFYTWTDAESSITYDFEQAVYLEGVTELGDIAEHKLHASLDVPLGRRNHLNLRGVHMGEKTLYLRNALREKGRTAGAYSVLDAAWTSSFTDRLSLTVKVNNVFDTRYFHPGIEQAGGGDDFEHRSTGFRNSLLPQPGRRYLINLRFK